MKLNEKLSIIFDYTNQRLRNNESGVNLAAQGWTVRGNNRLTRAIGRCNYKNKEIEISTKLAECLEKDEWENVVNHEIAHALTPHHGHDATWMRMAVKLGANPTASMKLKNAKPASPKYAMVYFHEGVMSTVRFCNRRVSLANKYIPGKKAQTLNNLKLISYSEWERRANEMIEKAGIRV